MSDNAFEALFNDSCTVADESKTVERGGILAWRILYTPAHSRIGLSLMSREQWQDDSWHNEARCNLECLLCRASTHVSWMPHASDNPAPHPGHVACGFYSFDSENSALHGYVLHAGSGDAEFTVGLHAQHGDYSPGAFIVAPVIIAGKVIPHKNGYRSSRMRLLNGNCPFGMSVKTAVQMAEQIGATISQEDQKKCL